MPTDTDDTCLGPNIQLSLDALLGAMTGIINDIKSVQTSSEILSESITELKQILKHYHDSHLHAYPHDGQDKYDVPIGKTVLPNIITPAEHLLHEYNTNYDMDQNGLIYGTDFKLTGDNIPRIIEQINNTLDPSKYKQLTMEQYIATVPNHEKIWAK